jgi:cardiolipin synthase
VLGREFAAQMQAMFARDLAASEEVEALAWEHRSLLLRIREWFGSLVQRWL